MKPYERPEIKEKLDRITAAILDAVPDTEAIYLFGSYAYGEPREDSDFDICVVVPESAKAYLKFSTDERLSLEVAVCGIAKKSVDFFVKPAELFSQKSVSRYWSFDKEISRGVRIYAR